MKTTEKKTYLSGLMFILTLCLLLASCGKKDDPKPDNYAAPTTTGKPTSDIMQDPPVKP